MKAGCDSPILGIHDCNHNRTDRSQYQLGGGQILVQHTYLVTFALDGHTQTVETLFADSDEILLGVDAMREYRLVIDFPANSVTLERPAVP